MCKPFPAQVFGADGFDAAVAAVQAFSQLDPTVPDVQLQLLQWLLLHLQRTWAVSAATSRQFLEDVQHLGSSASGAMQAVRQACSILRVTPACQQPVGQQQQGRRILAYHGTDFSAVHSILHQGLLAASGTRLQTTGAVFGQGIYLSTDFATSFQFTKGRPAWQHSTLGANLRCVLVCEVAEQATLPSHSSTARSDSRQVTLQRQGLSLDVLCWLHQLAVDGVALVVACVAAARSACPQHALEVVRAVMGWHVCMCSLPDTYIVAPKPSDVQIKFLLVFSDDTLLGHSPRFSSSSAAGGRRSTDAAAGDGAAAAAAGVRRWSAVDVCWVMTCAYLGFMVLYGLWRQGR